MPVPLRWFFFEQCGLGFLWIVPPVSPTAGELRSPVLCRERVAPTTLWRREFDAQNEHGLIGGQKMDQRRRRVLLCQGAQREWTRCACTWLRLPNLQQLHDSNDAGVSLVQNAFLGHNYGGDDAFFLNAA